jgi:hypothetical protein
MLVAGLVLVAAVPVFLIAGWSIAGWGLAAALWVFAQGFGLLVVRAPLSVTSPAKTGLVGFAMMFRTLAILIALGTVAVKDPSLGAPALLLYVLAYTCELGLSLVTYFGNEPL